MLLTITYYNTKRFLKKGMKSFKSCFSGGYERLPKTPPCNPFSCTHTGINIIQGHPRESLQIMGSEVCKRSESLKYKLVGPDTFNHHTKTAATVKSMKLKEPKGIIKNKENKKLNNGKYEDESSKCLVIRKLKELEMMDQTDIDLVLDVEEVLHYYSRLTCPIYRDIVEKFLVEMYSGTFDLSRVENVVSKKRLIKI